MFICFATAAVRCHHGFNAEHLQEEMVSVSLRSTLISGAAFATAGVMALSPNIVAPPVITLAQPVVELPTVHVADIALTGFTLDLYSALNGWAAFGVQVLQDFFFWNPDIAAGIGNFYTALERVVTAVVTTIDGLVGAPTDFLGTLTTIVSTLLPAFGLGVPTLAAVGTSAASLTAARTGDGPRASASQGPEPVAVELPAVVEETPRIICCSPQPEVPAELPAAEAPVPAVAEIPAEVPAVAEAPAEVATPAVADPAPPARAVRSAVRAAVTVSAPGVDSSGVDSPGVDSPGVDAAGPSSAGAVRTPARATRGTADRATSAARASVTAATDAAN
jgi:hypothetical protein